MGLWGFNSGDSFACNPNAYKRLHIRGQIVSLVGAVVFCLCGLTSPAHATTAKHHGAGHAHKSRTKAASHISAQSGSLAFDERYSAIVIDASTGQTFHIHDADGLRFPASLTKMMTLYLTFEALAEGKLSFATQIPVSANASEQSPTKLGLRPGQTLTVRDAVMGLITKSANDAACALAEAMAGSEARFAEQMTRKARQLGMSQTIYRNASGLPDLEQHTTARDQSTLALHLQRDFPDQYPLFSTQEFRFRGAVHPNHNHLLKMYEGVDGLKTGFINASGFNLAASAKRNGHRIIGVVFGGPTSHTRDLRMMQLLDHGFARLEGRDQSLIAIREIHNGKAVHVAASTTTTEEGDTADDAPAPRAKTPAPKVIQPQQVAAIPTAVSNGPWGIQVGAFRSKASADQQIGLVRKTVPVLSNVKAVVMPDRPQKPRSHKARLIGLSESDATAACRALTSRSMPCFTLAPGSAKEG